MPLASPAAPTRPAAEPDWARWEAEFADRRGIDPGNPGPPAPPQPPTGGGGGGGRPGDDGRKPERNDFMWLKLLVASFAVMAVIGFVSTQQAGNRGPGSPVAAKATAAGDAKPVTVDSSSAHTRVVMNLPPAIPVR